MKKARDLSRAVTLRPADVFALYGIHPNTLGDWCRTDDKDKRLPSTLIQGRKGRKGVRLVAKTDLEAYLARFRVNGAELISRDLGVAPRANADDEKQAGAGTLPSAGTGRGSSTVERAVCSGAVAGSNPARGSSLPAGPVATEIRQQHLLTDAICELADVIHQHRT